MTDAEEITRYTIFMAFSFSFSQFTIFPLKLLLLWMNSSLYRSVWFLVTQIQTARFNCFLRSAQSFDVVHCYSNNYYLILSFWVGTFIVLANSYEWLIPKCPPFQWQDHIDLQHLNSLPSNLCGQMRKHSLDPWQPSVNFPCFISMQALESILVSLHMLPTTHLP